MATHTECTTLTRTGPQKVEGHQMNKSWFAYDLAQTNSSGWALVHGGTGMSACFCETLDGCRTVFEIIKWIGFATSPADVSCSLELAADIATKCRELWGARPDDVFAYAVKNGCDKLKTHKYIPGLST